MFASGGPLIAVKFGIGGCLKRAAGSGSLHHHHPQHCPSCFFLMCQFPSIVSCGKLRRLAVQAGYERQARAREQTNAEKSRRSSGKTWSALRPAIATHCDLYGGLRRHRRTAMTTSCLIATKHSRNGRRQIASMTANFIASPKRNPAGANQSKPIVHSNLSTRMAACLNVHSKHWLEFLPPNLRIWDTDRPTARQYCVPLVLRNDCFAQN